MKALVLSGGGVKGAYQVGVVKKLVLEDGNDYDFFGGVSVGALNSSVLAQVGYGNTGRAYGKLFDLWSTVNNDRIRKSWFLFGKLAAVWKGSFYNSEPLQKWVKEAVSQEALLASGKKLMVGATCLDTGAYNVVRETTPEIWKWVYASASFPLFFGEIGIGNSVWVDGGLRTITPLASAIEAGATEIDVVLASEPDFIEPWKHNGKRIWDKTARAFEIALTEIFLDDLKVVGLKNDLAKLGADYRDVKIRVYHPKGQLVEDSLEFDPKAIAGMMARGYEDACLGPRYHL